MLPFLHLTGGVCPEEGATTLLKGFVTASYLRYLVRSNSEIINNLPVPVDILTVQVLLSISMGLFAELERQWSGPLSKPIGWHNAYSLDSV